MLREKACNVAVAKPDTRYASPYGIFAGQPWSWAVLHFSAERARWVEGERWHMERQTEML